MAPLNHSIIIKGFEKLAADRNPNDFFFDFLKALKFPAATIKRLREPGNNRNVAIMQEDFALEKQIYFHKARPGEDLKHTLHSIVEDPQLINRKIRFFVTTDYENVVAYDKRVDDWIDFDFKDLRENYEFFLPLTGQYEKPLTYTSHPADVKACEKMGKLYDVIRAQNHYDKEHLHDLNVFLTRLLFCFFAEDTGIFPKEGQLTNAIESLTKADGSDLADFFERLFWILDMSPNHPGRSRETATLAAFPYVNGGLFHEKIRIPHFNTKARNILLECGHLSWREISPVIFGSMFQTVMDPDLRHERGEHYTSEENILKVIGPLFLDELKDELNKLLNDKSTHRNKKLKEFQDKLTSLKFLDPACGCGNFLIVSYRELKLLELEATKAIHNGDQNGPVLFEFWKDEISKVSINQFYGIEIEEFPVDIARVSMWLMEHVINIEFGKYFGQVFPSIPLRDSANIVRANALKLNWSSVIPINELNYIFGNPPFAGYKKQTADQKADLRLLFKSKKIDYVAGWFYKAIEICNINKLIKLAFVSTNSITQGEQVTNIWGEILEKFQIYINFAYKTFAWKNEAPNSAGVHVVIIGLSAKKPKKYWLIDKNRKELVNNINFYLLDFENIIIQPRPKPISNIEPMIYGSEPRDGNFLVFDYDEYKHIIDQYPDTSIYFKKYCSAEDFTSGKYRYCLWIGFNEYLHLKKIKLFDERFEKCREYRINSKQKQAHAAQSKPYEFASIRQPSSRYLLIPIATTSNRDYIPIGYVEPDIICSNACFTISNASLFTFGILNSWMHIVWVNSIGGKLKSDFRYSNQIIYNTFPWPQVSETEKTLIENLAQNVLLAREYYPDMSLADLYDRNKMPEELKRAHQELNIAVERLYRKKPFENDDDRLRHLFLRYENLINGQDDSSLFSEE